jgi:hypothetical protein
VPNQFFRILKLKFAKCRPVIAGAVLTGLICLGFLGILTACGTSDTSHDTAKTTKNTSGKTTVSTTKKSTLPTGDSVGLNSIEAPQLVWPKAQGNFGDAVLFRMAPVENEESTKLMLAGDWQKTGRSANWFIWYADADGENWLLLGIKGEDVDIGTRSFSAMTAGADWPREKPAVAIEDAAKAAVAQGANMDALTWVELACAYPAGEFAGGTRWVFECSETTDSGFTLNYRVFVDAVTGEVTGALNERNEALALPIDLASLEKPREESHKADLQSFFDLIIKKDWTFSIFQLSYNMAPDDATRQMWLANFQSLDSLEVVSIEPDSLLQWTDEWETYKVVLKIATSEPVDKYGWENGENTRWVTIIPQGAGSWKIEAISSSP